MWAEPPCEIPYPNEDGWKINLSKPDWLKVRLQTNLDYSRVKKILAEGSLHTVCREAQCPNSSECWSLGTATFIIMGDICTRSCAYCAVKKGHPLPLDDDEPDRVAEAVAKLKLDYAVITSVDRDDLPDGGAEHFAKVVERVKERNDGVKVEVLIPDFAGDKDSLGRLLRSNPDVLNHNTETVPRLYKRLRSKGIYVRCLELLRRSKEMTDGKMITKSGLMVGLGESNAEVIEVMDDLRKVGVDILTIGQYLRPSLKNVPVMKYRTLEEFQFYVEEGLKRGFKFVESAPLVRSSYRAKTHVESLLGKDYK
ncbi:lipoyl synthase [bacterium]|nr:lipoyl synthase [bacterium]